MENTEVLRDSFNVASDRPDRTKTVSHGNWHVVAQVASLSSPFNLVLTVSASELLQVRTKTITGHITEFIFHTTIQENLSIIQSRPISLPKVHFPMPPRPMVPPKACR